MMTQFALKLAFLMLTLGAVSLPDPASGPTIVKFEPVQSTKPAKKSDEPPPCPAKFDDSLETNGIAPRAGEGTGIKPPKLVHSVEAEFSEKARREGRSNTDGPKDFYSKISLVVDKQGKPTQICVVQAAGMGLDAEAGKAVRQYRFEPSTKDAEPVAVRISIEISFHLN